MLKYPKIIREFHVERSPGHIMTYPFTTYTQIFEKDNRPNFQRLCKYFRSVIRYGVPERAGKGSVSQQPKLMIETEYIDSPLVDFANKSDYYGMGMKQHDRVQEYMHEHNPFTFATEIPVWSEVEELIGKSQFDGEIIECIYWERDRNKCNDCMEEFCKRHVKCHHLLHGHIDGLDYMPDDKILVWDFKPNAEKETKAASQVRRYMSLLSLRTGILIEDMTGVYFDGSYAYQLI